MGFEARFAALSDCVEIPNGLRELEDAWLSLHFPEDVSKESFRELRDALLLTGAMGHSEFMNGYWEDELVRTTGLYMIEDLTRSITILPRYKLYFGRLREATQWDSFMRNLFGYDDLDDEFTKDWEQIVSLREEHERETMGHPITIPIVFYVGASGGMSVPDQVEYLKAVSNVLRNVRQSSAEFARSHPNLPRFDLVGVELVLDELTITAEVVQVVQELLASDVIFTEFVPPCVVSEDHPWREAWASLMFTVCGHSCASVKAFHHVEALRILPHEVSEDMFQALCSVVADATILKSFVVENSGRSSKLSNDTKWRWLLYALFSKASTTSVEVADSKCYQFLPVNGPVDVAAVINAAFPQTQLLVDSLSAHDMDYGVASLPQGAQILIDTETILVQQHQGQTFEIIRNDSSSPTLDIVVPGYGHGKIARQEAEIILDRTKDSPIKRRGIKHLTLDDSKSNSNCALLLPLIGRNLTSVHITTSNQGEEFLELLFSNCPNLEKISIFELRATHLRPIINALSADNSRLTTIRLTEWQLTNDEAMIEFLTLLADPKSKPAQRLQQLVLNDQYCSKKTMTTKSARLVAKVVHFNTRLQYLGVHLSQAATTVYKHAIAKLKSESKRTVSSNGDDEDLGEDGYAMVPLSMSAKCAFLSTFPQQSGRHDRRSIDLDPTLMIFEFAASITQRCIVVKPIPMFG
ncbi:hypothetical protein Poli38472_011177 [Pythium oligandrum]|uniref:Uncharacterized protein n=1 Tax=Pythium oligandrum TaxID=41045 RepID=A0A8K1CRU2_PYTOL|nr:hypothetical protein Poli38472_011177 [Pythium oligandrum]|eukprot:TMW67557.1 hypothetical protein Poli38472_011177 [Pythium oligandrum]